jgi:hypothetical protein
VTPALPASPPDISAILTSLGVFSLAIAAVVGGIYKGIKEVKKGGADTGSEVKSAILMETVTARSLSDSNLQLVASNREIADLLRALDHRAAQLIEALQDHRAITRSQIEEQHRLRAATVDLLEIMRRRP